MTETGRRALLVLLAVAPVLGCGGDPTSTPTFGPPAQLTRLDADTVRGTVGADATAPLRVRVTDADGRAVPGVAVDFRVIAGGGTLTVLATGGAVSAGAVVDSTNANGEASATWTLGTRTGLQTAAARVGAVGEVTFTAVAAADVPADLTPLEEAAFVGIAGAAADGPLVVRVIDRFNNVVPDAAVSWSALTVGAAVGAASSNTDESGVARVAVTLAAAPIVNLFTASITGLAPDTFGVIGVVGTTDPREDAFSSGDSSFVSHDVVFFGGTVIDDVLVLYVRFAEPVLAVATGASQPPNALLGNLDLDLDRDSTTGFATLRQCIGGDPLGFGTDAFVDLNQQSGFLGEFDDPPVGAVVVARVDSLDGADPCNSSFFGSLLATVPEYRDSTVTLGIPLAFLEDDGEFDLTTLFASAGTANVTDLAPDSLAYTFSVPAPLPPAVGVTAPIATQRLRALVPLNTRVEPMGAMSRRPRR